MKTDRWPDPIAETLAVTPLGPDLLVVFRDAAGNQVSFALQRTAARTLAEMLDKVLPDSAGTP